MLVITEKSGETIQVGDALVKVEIIGKRVRLFIEAPLSTRVLRSDILKREANKTTKTTTEKDAA